MVWDSLKRLVNGWRTVTSVSAIVICLANTGAGHAGEGLRLPAPTTVSEEAQQFLNKNSHSTSTEYINRSKEQWAALRDARTEVTEQTAQREIEATGVVVTAIDVGGVTVHEITPKHITGRNKKKALMYLHGGGYVFSPGLSGVRGAATAADLGQIKIWVVDYRMPPEEPFPAALEDALTVYKAMLEEFGANDIAVYGDSAGAGLALSLMLAAHEAGLKMPSALGLFSPWSDLTDAGDTYTSLQGLDPVLPSYDAALKGTAELYADGRNLKDPLLSPVYGEYGDWFPPTYMIAGTRDLFLSNTVRMHRVLRRADVPVVLDVFEGMWHGFAGVPEKEEATLEMLEFFDDELH